MNATSRITPSLTTAIALFGALVGGANAAVVSLGSFGGHDYYYDTGSYDSKESASAAAATIGAQLASITTESENDFLITAIGPLVDSSLRAAWIGLTRPNPTVDFKWDSGESLDYTNWRPAGTGGFDFSEPTNGTDETVGVMYINSPREIPLGQWADTHSSGTESFNAIFEEVPEPSSILPSLLLLGFGSLSFALGRSRRHA